MNLHLFRRAYGILNSTQRRGALVLFFFMIIGMTMETLGIGMVIPVLALLNRENIVVDYPVITPVLDLLGSPDRPTLVLYVMGLLVLVYLVKSLFLAFLAWRQTRFAYDLQRHLSQKLFEIYLRQPYAFHLQHNSAELIRNITIEVGLFTANAVTPTLQILAETLVVVGLFALLIFIQPLGGMLTFLVLGLALGIFRGLTKNLISAWGLARQEHEGLRLQHLQQGLGGVKDAKILGRETEFLNRFRFHDDRSARAGQYQMTIQLMPRLWMEFLAAVGLAVLVGTMIFQGHELGSIVPVLGVFTATAFRLMPSLNRVFGALQSLRYALPIIDSLATQMSLPVEKTESTNGVRASAFRNKIQVLRVDFQYPETQRPALMDIDLSISKGEAVGFVGESGSGKSTLVDVILGLLAPSAGVVKVDNQDIQENLRLWQNQIGYVPQSIFLTDDTLRRNIAFGIPESEIDEDALKRALIGAQLDTFVAGLPEGLETSVGERGVRLSGGQRQRIGIARALYHDPAVLVLDEGTSALDQSTESEIVRNVYALSGDKTIIVVAHRLSTVTGCDRVYRFDKGRIVESGTPGEILRL